MRRKLLVRLSEEELELVNKLRLIIHKRGTKLLPIPITDKIKFDGSNGSTVGLAVAYTIRQLGGKS